MDYYDIYLSGIDRLNYQLLFDAVGEEELHGAFYQTNFHCTVINAAAQAHERQ